MGRKYRQQGYQDDAGEKREHRRVPRSAGRREGPRSPRMTGFRKLFRCAMCGASLPASFDEIEFSSSCPKCEADLHTCRNCVHFDTAARFECTQPIPRRVSPKDRANKCTFFEAKTRVEKEIGSAPAQTRDLDPREAFENLFKK